MNHDDVYRVTEENGIITGIELKGGKEAYEFLGFRNDVKKSEDVIPTTTRRNFRHSTSFVVYELDQLQKNNIKRMARGRFMAIVENRGKNANSFELLGKNVGLEMQAGVIRDAHQNGGFFIINLATPDNEVEFEKKLPQTIGTSYSDAIDIIDGSFEIHKIFDDTFDFTFE